MPVSSAASVFSRRLSADFGVAGQSDKSMTASKLTAAGNNSIRLGSYLSASNTDNRDYVQLSEFSSFGVLELMEVQSNSASQRRVKRTVLKNLITADKAIRLTKELLPYGAPNQAVDVWRTDARNVGLRRERLLSGKPDTLETVVRSGAGNCAEHSRITAALILSEPTKSPVFRVRASEIDHNFVLMGDPRAQKSTTVVVADSWVTLPIAHTLDEGNFTPGAILEQFAPSDRVDPQFQISEQWRPAFIEADGNGNAKEYILGKVGGAELFTEWVSSEVVGGSFISKQADQSYVFDRFSSGHIESLLNLYGEYSEWMSGQEEIG